MTSRRERDDDTIADLADALATLSSGAVAAFEHTPASEGASEVAAIVATDRAMLRALGEPVPAANSFDAVRPLLIGALRVQPRRGRVPWQGGPMTVRWALQNRLAATWSVVDRLAERSGSPRPPADRHIVELALDLLPHSFLRAGRAAPETTVALELIGTDGAPWQVVGRQPADWPAPRDRVTGPAVDLCRLACGTVTRADTRLVADGAVADAWLDVVDALAYSDPPA